MADRAHAQHHRFPLAPQSLPDHKFESETIMIESLFLELGGWSWMILGLILLILEIVAAGTFFLWFGVAALVVGITTFAFGEAGFWTLQAQLITFVFLSIIFVFVGRRLMKRHKFEANDAPNLNQRVQQMIGHEAVLIEEISQGVGRIKIGDTTWQVTGQDAPVGTKVKITGGEAGTMLMVEPV